MENYYIKDSVCRKCRRCWAVLRSHNRGLANCALLLFSFTPMVTVSKALEITGDVCS